MTDDPDRPGNPVLWSGNESNTDATAVTQVTVPTADPTLTFLAKYGAEAGFDYGYVHGVDGRWRYLHHDPGRQHRRRTARARS